MVVIIILTTLYIIPYAKNTYTEPRTACTVHLHVPVASATWMHAEYLSNHAASLCMCPCPLISVPVHHAHSTYPPMFRCCLYARACTLLPVATVTLLCRAAVPAAAQECSFLVVIVVVMLLW